MVLSHTLRPLPSYDLPKMKPQNAIGPQVHRLRLRLEIAEAAFADRLSAEGWKTTAEEISAIENQKRAVSDIEILYLARALGVDLGVLFSGAAPDDTAR